MIKQRISDISDVILKKSNNEELPYIEIGDIDIETKQYINKDKPAVEGALKAKKDHVLISKVRPTRGAVTIIAKDCLVSNAFVVLQARKLIIPRYLFYSIAYNKRFFLRLGKLERGTSYPSCRAKDILTYKISVPTISEQKEIVKILDAANNLRQKRKEQLALLDDYLKSVFLEMFGDPIINRKNWIKIFLKEITNLITDGKHGDCGDDENSGYYFISAKDIHDGIIDYSQARQILKKDFEEVHRRTNLAIGDLVMVNTGATIGKTAIVNNDKKTCSTTFQKSVAIIKPKINKLTSIYLKYVFILRINAFAGMSSGSAQKNLLLSQMRDFKIPLPSIKLQNKFASIVKQVKKTKQKMHNSLDEMDNHFNALMQRYFE